MNSNEIEQKKQPKTTKNIQPNRADEFPILII